MRSRLSLPRIRSFYGVDFSGAKEAGRNIWVARAGRSQGRLKLLELNSLERLAGTAAREPALAHLVDLIRQSVGSLWAMDFPFGLPIEVMDGAPAWRDQLAWVRDWPDEAYALGVECVRRSKLLGDRMHIRRRTDTLAKAPFDCYHYRIIYQTFHGMRDVLLPLSTARGVAVLPFHYRKLSRARAVVMECCPSSVLKRLALPHQNYKQPTGGPLVLKRRRTRHAIVAGLRRFIDIDPRDLRTMMRNPGGDAIDAVIAAVGGYAGWTTADHLAIARDDRFPVEGYLYC
ncbi:MAG TPA: hypothetical protein VF796_09255 [Humisphaera sp.]